MTRTRTLYSPSPLSPHHLLCLADGTGWYVPDPPRPTRDGWEITPDDLEGRDVVLSNLSDAEIFALCNEADPLPEILRRRASAVPEVGPYCAERAAEVEARVKAAGAKIVQLETEIARLRARLADALAAAADARWDLEV